jgi:hypothetical protein
MVYSAYRAGEGLTMQQLAPRVTKLLRGWPGVQVILVSSWEQGFYAFTEFAQTFCYPKASN